MRNLAKFGAMPCLILAGTMFATVASAATVSIVKDNTVVDNIPGLTNFTTSGDMMAGMTVTATFSVGGSFAAVWGTTGAGSGGAFSTAFSLVESGDTFSNPWTFTILGEDLGQLTTLVLDGTPGLTVFDTTIPNPGTDGSAQGLDFAFSGTPDFDVTATYSNIIGIGGADPVGDIFHVLTVAFVDGPRTGSFSFLQDTDNDARLAQTPEPATLGLLGLALIGLGATRRRRRA